VYICTRFIILAILTIITLMFSFYQRYIELNKHYAMQCHTQTSETKVYTCLQYYSRCKTITIILTNSKVYKGHIYLQLNKICFFSQFPNLKAFERILWKIKKTHRITKKEVKNIEIKLKCPFNRSATMKESLNVTYATVSYSALGGVPQRKLKKNFS